MKQGCTEHTGFEFSPSVACGDSSLVRGSQGGGIEPFAQRLLSKRTRGWRPLRPPQSLAPDKRMRNALPPSTPCLPCVRGGAERMRSGGVVGRVQEEVTCYRQPVPARYPQPLSQGLWPCQLPLHRGAKPRGTKVSRRGSQALRGTACPSKSRPVLLDKAAPGCYSCVSKNGCHCRWRSSLNEFSARRKRRLPLWWAVISYV